MRTTTLLAARRLLPSPRQRWVAGVRHATRDAAAHGVAAEADASAPTLAVRLATNPLATLRVSGRCAAVTVKTNMETYVADVSAELDGTPCDPAAVASFDTLEDGNLDVSAFGPGAAITVAVPAAFNVQVAMSDGACDVGMRGWLEGDVDLSTERGSVHVGTVKGMLT
eukprot:2110138-Prymnesium_polylepis.1